MAGRAPRARASTSSCSHEVSPEFREYERTVTTVVERVPAPGVPRRTCGGLGRLADEVLVMTSAGGLVPVADAAALPGRAAAVGPGRRRARRGRGRAAACGFPDAVTFDMGGTSTDVCLVLGGVPGPAPRAHGRRLPGPAAVARRSTPSAPAAGRSRASTRAARSSVGPESAGADPGPACYGRGGTAPTVTDADLVLGPHPGRRRASPASGGSTSPPLARALDRAGVTADGVVAVVDAAMERAVRVVTVEQRRRSPRGSRCVAFGGAGPLHACALADALGMRAVVVPPRAGVLSAVGLALRAASSASSCVVADSASTTPASTTRAPSSAARAAALGARGVTSTTALDCRYAGQSHELTGADVDDFPAEHERRNGYARPDVAVEVVALRAARSLAAPLDRRPTSRRPRVLGGAGSRGRRRARLHGLGARGLGGRRPVRRARWMRGAAREPRPGRAPGPVSRLAGVADEMGAVLRRAASSPNIKERADCSAALFTADGELLVQAEHIPVHLGSMPASVRGRDRRLRRRRRPGDQVVLNDPFAGGTHLNDVTLVAPVLRRRRGSSAGSPTAPTTPTSAARRPGSMPPDATEIDAGGAAPPADAASTDEVAAVLSSRRRARPTSGAGDLDAQRGANVRRRPRGWPSSCALGDAAARRGRSTTASGGCAPRSRACPTATWPFDDVLDSTGPRPEQQTPDAHRRRR